MSFKIGNIPWNKNITGYKNKPCSEETKRKISEWQKGEKSYWYGKKRSEETKIKIGKSCKGFRHSEETKKKISETKKGIHRSEETKNKLRQANLGKKASEEARRKMSESRKGKKNWHWQGGITPISLKIRNNIEFKLWRESVFVRDNYTCQKCDIKSRYAIKVYLHAHHIQNFSQFPELRFNPNNGITFCKDCHNEFHKIYGRQNNTREQLNEFLCQE